jgi:hypothetical protein
MTDSHSVSRFRLSSQVLQLRTAHYEHLRRCCGRVNLSKIAQGWATMIGVEGHWSSNHASSEANFGQRDSDPCPITVARPAPVFVSLCPCVAWNQVEKISSSPHGSSNEMKSDGDSPKSYDISGSRTIPVCGITVNGLGSGSRSHRENATNPYLQLPAEPAVASGS